jgi:hypothetical protein
MDCSYSLGIAGRLTKSNNEAVRRPWQRGRTWRRRGGSQAGPQEGRVAAVASFFFLEYCCGGARTGTSSQSDTPMRACTSHAGRSMNSFCFHHESKGVPATRGGVSTGGTSAVIATTLTTESVDALE